MERERKASHMTKISTAHAEFLRAVEKVSDAERARGEAHDRLEAALAEVGWTRLRGAFYPDATPLYVNVLYPSSTLTIDEVLRVLEQQRAAA